MMINHLRDHFANEEIDYLQLNNLLSQYYKYPRDKIKSLLEKQTIIRIKKGLYIFGPGEAHSAYFKEVLANLIYGPSAISCEYMLSFYGMIPERVEVVTSITNKRDKVFDTPVGRFTYKYLHPKKYGVGVTQMKLDASHYIIVATPEKALADQILFSKTQLQNESEMAQYLFENLRIDKDRLLHLNHLLFKRIQKVYQDPRLGLLIQLLEKMKRNNYE